MWWFGHFFLLPHVPIQSRKSYISSSMAVILTSPNQKTIILSSQNRVITSINVVQTLKSIIEGKWPKWIEISLFWQSLRWSHLTQRMSGVLVTMLKWRNWLDIYKNIQLVNCHPPRYNKHLNTQYILQNTQIWSSYRVVSSLDSWLSF